MYAEFTQKYRAYASITEIMQNNAKIMHIMQKLLNN